MEVATNPNNTNLFPNSLTLHIYKTILLFILISVSVCLNELALKCRIYKNRLKLFRNLHFWMFCACSTGFSVLREFFAFEKFRQILF